MVNCDQIKMARALFYLENKYIDMFKFIHIQVFIVYQKKKKKLKKEK